MNSMKCRIRMEALRPSEGNPREDMGDLDALARSIEATGGEPVNPLVVVRDGEVYRIVDGERRFRALVRLGADEVDCICFLDYSDAMAARAMMATNDKKLLTDKERGRGFQSMLVLGVPEGEGAAAAGIEVEQFRRARRAAHAVKPDQPSLPGLDALIAAGDDDFTDEEMAEILDHDGQGAVVVADGIRRRKRDRAKADKILESLPDEILSFDSQAEMREWAKAGGLALTWAGSLRKPGDVGEIKAEREGGELLAYPDGPFVYVYEAFEAGADEEGDAEAEARAAELAARRQALASLEATWLAAIAKDRAMLAAFDATAVEDRSMPWWCDEPDDDEGGSLWSILEDAIGCAPSMWERACQLADLMRADILSGYASNMRLETFLAAYDRLADLGAWEPTDADEALREHVAAQLGGDAHGA